MFWLFSEEVVDEVTPSNNSLPRVTALAISTQEIPVPMTSQGSISARWRSIMTSDIGGKVMFVSPKLLVGGEFNQNDVLLRIDDTRYRAELAEAQSALATAKQSYYEEQQSAKRAKQDWETSGLVGQPSDLLLRKPQMAATKQQIKAAKIAVEHAQRNLQGVNIKAPYDGATIKRNVSLGSYLAPEAEIAEIYANKRLQVHLSLLPSQLSMLANDSGVVLRDITGQHQWQAKITRRSKVIEPNSRMVKVVAELDGDASIDSLPLLGQFVQAELSGPSQANILQVPQSCISGDSRIWVVDDNSSLQLFDHIYLSENKEFVYLQSQASANSSVFNIVCYPSKSFYVGMSVAMQLKTER